MICLTSRNLFRLRGLQVKELQAEYKFQANGQTLNDFGCFDSVSIQNAIESTLALFYLTACL